jgi:ketosteroid isomerase-like protein
MSEENVAAVRRQHEHFSRTGEVLVEIYHRDAEWVAAREDPDAATHRGLEAIRGYFAQWTGMFESIEFRADELIDAGDKVFAWIRFSGQGAASGAPVETEQAQIWTFRDGQVVRVEEYFDRAEGLEAAGLREYGHTARAMDNEREDSENKPPEEPHPDEPRGNGQAAVEAGQDEGKAGEPHPDETTEPGEE